jgi:hypothetical protein
MLFAIGTGQRHRVQAGGGVHWPRGKFPDGLLVSAGRRQFLSGRNLWAFLPWTCVRNRMGLLWVMACKVPVIVDEQRFVFELDVDANTAAPIGASVRVTNRTALPSSMPSGTVSARRALRCSTIPAEIYSPASRGDDPEARRHSTSNEPGCLSNEVYMLSTCSML